MEHAVTSSAYVHGDWENSMTALYFCKHHIESPLLCVDAAPQKQRNLSHNFLVAKSKFEINFDLTVRYLPDISLDSNIYLA